MDGQTDGQKFHISIVLQNVRMILTFCHFSFPIYKPEQEWIGVFQ